MPWIERLLNHPPKNPTLEEEWLVRYSRFVIIKFLGVFDTVGSLGVPMGVSRFKKVAQSFRNGESFAALHSLNRRRRVMAAAKKATKKTAR
ncbi:DUF2235 domain-containing protein (plasmid) [Bradyrhizobium guangxiense]